MKKFDLTEQQKIQFYTDGYLILKNVVDKETLRLAKRKINQFIGKGLSEQQMDDMKKGNFHPPIITSPEITNCFNNSNCIPYLESILGDGKMKKKKFKIYNI